MSAIDAEVTMVEPTDHDAELMHASSRGDVEAFARIVDRHKDGLVNYLTHLTGSRDHAEELSQEAFLRLYQSSAHYDDRGKLSAYLYSIGTNLVRTEQRRRTRWLRLLPKLSVHASQEISTPQSGVLSDEARGEVQRALEELPIHYRAPIILRELEGWSYQEIAAALGCRTGTIKSRINRARERLRELLTEYWTQREAGGEQ